MLLSQFKCITAYTLELEITQELNGDGKSKWKGTLVNSFGYKLENVSITDPKFVKRLESGKRPQNPCLITVGKWLLHQFQE